MTRWLFAAALGVATVHSAAGGEGAPVVPLSDAPTAMPSAMAGVPGVAVEAAPASVMSQRFGLVPWLRKSVFWKGDYGACASCDTPAPKHPLLSRFHGHPGLGHGGHHGGDGGGFPGQGVPGVPQPGQPGMGMPGTLVFPVNPYIRSPRDFFMHEAK